MLLTWCAFTTACAGDDGAEAGGQGGAASGPGGATITSSSASGSTASNGEGGSGSPASGAGGSEGGGEPTSSSAGGGGGVGPGFPELDARCATPAQDGVDTTSWPEVFIGTAEHGCSDDAAAGTFETPLCNPHLAADRVDRAGTIITFRGGTYRLADFEGPDGPGGIGLPGREDYGADAFLLVRSEPGSTAILVGSIRLAGGWEEHSSSPRVFRLDVSDLPADPKALYEVVDGPEQLFDEARRFRHMMVFRDGARSHADVADLVDGSEGSPETSMTEDRSTHDFTWTKANAAGEGCGSDNAGCFIYLRADDAGFEPGEKAFEASQYNAIGGPSGRLDYLVVDGIATRFTQCGGLNCSLWLEGSDYVVVQNSSFGHVANSDDNSYGIGLWNTNGSIVRRNRVFDSAYWGGTPNSKGITFMISGQEAPNWVCGNEVFHIPGDAAICSKSGVQRLQVIGNYVHDCEVGVVTNGDRTQDGTLYAGGAYAIEQNIFERNGSGVALSQPGGDGGTAGDAGAGPDVVANNLFIDNRSGVRLATQMTPGARVFNNIFLGGPVANACSGEDCGAAIYYANNAGEVRDFEHPLGQLGVVLSNNLFHEHDASHGVNRNWTANYEFFTLAEFQATYASESGSLDADPLLDADFRPAAGSPAVDAGFAEYYGLESVHIGPHLQ
jgi:hypothetical protein